MGREQGDELGDEVVYVLPGDDEAGERRAYVPADHVNLQARGWVRRQDSKKSARSTASSSPSSGGGSNAGSGPA